MTPSSAALHEPELPLARGTPRVARVDIVRDMAAVESLWRSLETGAFVYTPFQRYDFLNAWSNSVGRAKSVEAFIVIAKDDRGDVLMLLPLGIERDHRIATFLGGKHVTFNMGLCRRDFAACAAKADIDTIIDAIRRSDHAPAALAFFQQPRRWEALTNPLHHLGGQRSVNACPLLAMMPGTKPQSRISNSIRRRLKNKERKLEALRGYRYVLATSDADITRLIDAFFATKPLRLADQGLPNVFDDVGVRDFIYDICLTKRSNGRRLIELHGLETSDEMLAIFAGVADDQRFSMIFNTYAISEHARFSPGLILLRHIIDHYAALNFTSLDLGTGSDHYKRLFCKDNEETFDGFVPLTMRGRLIAARLSLAGHVKRLIKQSTLLHRAAEAVRARFA